MSNVELVYQNNLTVKRKNSLFLWKIAVWKRIHIFGMDGLKITFHPKIQKNQSIDNAKNKLYICRNLWNGWASFSACQNLANLLEKNDKNTFIEIHSLPIITYGINSKIL